MKEGGGSMNRSSSPTFVHIAISNDLSSHNIGIASNGLAYTWGKTNSLGQLGRTGKKNVPQPALFANPEQQQQQHEREESSKSITSVRGYVGGFKDAGHSAILDSQGFLWFSGCDRWQQLGLGSSSGGAAGYTWKNGALWQETFQRNDYLRNLMNGHKEKNDDKEPMRIRDVALGGDHTVILANNKKDIFTFGKGREGQLGLSAEKPFVSTPVYAKGISSAKRGEIAAVCAVQHCTFTLDDDGNILKKAGKCRNMNSDFMKKILQHCRDRGRIDGLIDANK
jgi:alpha-tubulin suppressor-like RCC1 family protein